MHICYWKYISILLLVLTFPNASAEKNVKMEKLEEWRENEWILESIIQDTVHASVNGKITHGDRLRIRFKKGNCDLPNMLASFYTTTIPLKETVLEGKIIDAKLELKKLSNQTRFYRMSYDIPHRTNELTPFIIDFTSN